MQTRLFALVLGVVYLFLGILGFIPALYTTPPAGAPHLDVGGSYGYLFGIFPQNVLSDLFHILVGLAGIITGSRLALARYYSMTIFLVFGALTFVGFLTTVDTLDGILPIFGSDTWLDAATCISAGYFGFVAPESTHVAPAHTAAH
jgi:hypothetical protein